MQFNVWMNWKNWGWYGMDKRKKRYCFQTNSSRPTIFQDDYYSHQKVNQNHLPRNIVVGNNFVHIFDSDGCYLPEIIPMLWKKQAIFYRHRKTGLRVNFTKTPVTVFSNNIEYRVSEILRLDIILP